MVGGPGELETTAPQQGDAGHGRGLAETPNVQILIETRIPDEDSIFRRLGGSRMTCIDSVTGEERPTSGAFMPDPNEDGVSVYRASVLDAMGLTWTVVIRNQSTRVVELGVSDVRAIEPLDVEPDPWPNEMDEADHARNAAHALITGWVGHSKNQRHKLAQSLAKVASFMGGNVAPDDTN